MGAQDENNYVSKCDRLTAWIRKQKELGHITATEDLSELWAHMTWESTPNRPWEPCSCGAKYDRHFPDLHLQYCYYYRGQP